ncbi:hypothetical protein RC96_04660 [Pectobacterium carotovorum subsp. carotovorum]|nr:hypothetical protein RC96_04660 [Pectobacterium carotovorum subsp. carotovorum]KHT37711.1 hypothetical protein RC99_09535 [Pectobacterium carotovorum subsp. carotovorum]RJL47270.1 hypothetical protein D5078_06835 [Pectobacterium carotovorum]
MDAAKACAASDKNVNDVFEQHLCWPVGRVPFMGRVSASQAVRTAGMNTEGTAKRRDLPRKARGHGATATEPPRVGRVRRELQRLPLLIAHETFTVTTETKNNKRAIYRPCAIDAEDKKGLFPRSRLHRH